MKILRKNEVKHNYKKNAITEIKNNISKSEINM